MKKNHLIGTLLYSLYVDAAAVPQKKISTFLKKKRRGGGEKRALNLFRVNKF